MSRVQWTQTVQAVKNVALDSVNNAVQPLTVPVTMQGNTVHQTFVQTVLVEAVLTNAVLESTAVGTHQFLVTIATLETAVKTLTVEAGHVMMLIIPAQLTAPWTLTAVQEINAALLCA